MPDKIKRMQIIFDLDSVKLEEIEKNSSKNIYSKIRVFMEKNGFDHIEYSGYVSREPVRLARVYEVVKTLRAAFPILNDTVNDMHVTEVGNTYLLARSFVSYRRLVQLITRA